MVIGLVAAMGSAALPFASAAQTATTEVESDVPAAARARSTTDTADAAPRSTVNGPLDHLLPNRFASLGTALRAQGFEVPEVCFLYRAARDDSYDEGRVSILAGSLSEIPVPDSIRDALGVLKSADSSAPAKLNARSDVARFFGGACSKPTVSETSCTLAVTLINARAVQLPRIANQLQFVLFGSDLGTDAMATNLATLADSSGSESAIASARDAVTSDVTAFCELSGATTEAPSPEPTAEPTPEPTPEPTAEPTPVPDDGGHEDEEEEDEDTGADEASEALPETGSSSLWMAQVGLWILALGAAFLALTQDAAARERRRQLK